MSKQTRRAIAGFVLIVLGWTMFYVDIPAAHSHNVQMVVGGLLILFGGVFIDKELTEGFVETVKSIVFFLRNGSADESD